MPTSFRKTVHPTPFRYRTPSPPRDAFEPLSPTLGEGTTNGDLALQLTDNREARNGLKRACSEQHEEVNGSKKQRHVSEGAMDVFASIALATKSINPRKTSIPASSKSISGRSDRPSKRAKSEKLPSSDWSKKRKGADLRPATSYEQSPEDRRLEAELLLNFAQANFVQAVTWPKSPSPVESQGMRQRPRTVPETTNHAMPEGDVHDEIGGGQAHGSRAFREKQNTRSGVEAQSPLQENAKAVDGIPGGNTPDNKQPLNGPPNTFKVVDEILDVGEFHPAGQKPMAPEISNYDNIDPISVPSPFGTDTLAGQEEKLGEFEDRSSPDIRSLTVVPILQDDIAPDNGSLSDTTPQPRLNSGPPVDEILQLGEGDAKFEGDSLDELNAQEMEKLPQERVENESRTIHGALGDHDVTMNKDLEAPGKDRMPSIPPIHSYLGSDTGASTPDLQEPTSATAVCATCKFTRSKGIETENDSTSWIGCDACKSWFHFACAGFKNEREVRSVDKFRCRRCKPIHGSTTYVRKSSRAHSAIDYAGLHQGVIKTSDERPEHHYIKPIKEGTITFLPETFARMRPELVTAEYFEKGTGMKEPVVIPTCFNARSKIASIAERSSQNDDMPIGSLPEDDDTAEDWLSRHAECEMVSDHGQDALDMVIPQGLTVRQVAELYGPEEKVEVIDVKSQNGESKKWNMKRWADYYENPNNKVVRNVISLEVSQSRLGRLIRRPQIVRDLDLQDSVWPEDLLAKGEYPRVQFYCLMSVADCFTDFHIDFGGSSVFYHILKGKKTFLFIPPKEKHLKKYEEWCMSPAQNWTFLGDQTKECYRVDLSEGDTMLIPSGWIHAVWTPEDSLVIGGNFLTRMNFGMQLRVAQVEKATGVARKFRYPHFQKLHWYTALRYLENDPLPGNVRDLLHAGGSFCRETSAHHEFDAWGENSRAGLENYHARYYSQPELEGLPDLTRYLLRTALIDIGSITDGISADTRNAVKKSIPRGHGEPLDIMKTFAAWCAWKRGNEPIPHWAYPDAVPENLSPDKLSAAAMKKLDREAALSAPRRHSARMQSQQELSQKASSESQLPSTSPSDWIGSDTKQPCSTLGAQGQNDLAVSGTPKRPRITSATGPGSHRKTACETCRKRRRACKHKDQVAASMATSAFNIAGTESVGLQIGLPTAIATPESRLYPECDRFDTRALDEAPTSSNGGARNINPEQSLNPQPSHHEPTQTYDVVAAHPSTSQEMLPIVPEVNLQLPEHADRGLEAILGSAAQARPRHKACNDCRKSKVRDFYHEIRRLQLMQLLAPLYPRCLW